MPDLLTPEVLTALFQVILIDLVLAGDNAIETLAQACWQIVVADVSMSLDNVLAVVGVAREHP